MANLIMARWRGLEPRERLLIGWGCALLLLALFYVSIWQPWHKAISHMEEAIQHRRASLVWMQQQGELIQSGETSGQAKGFRGADQSLLAIVERTARTFKIREAIQQIVPASNGEEVRVVLEQANFNQWVKWIDSLYRNYGVNIKQLSAEREEGLPNVAEIRITFER